MRCIKLNINKKKFLNLVNLELQVFNPVNAFMSKEDMTSVIETLYLTNNNFFPIPIYFDVDQTTYNSIKNNDLIMLYYNNKKVCSLNIISIFNLKSKKKLGSKLFGTNDENHPGFNDFLKSQKFFIHGKINNFNYDILNKYNFSEPNKVIKNINRLRFKSIAAFHTRNVPHKGHEWIHRYGLKICDALMIQPLIGQFRKNEFKEKIIIKTNKILTNQIYKNKKIILEFFNYYPIYAGPREALFHALARKNYGCTHFLVGRDHAGVTNAFGKNYYKKYASQKLCIKYQSSINIKVIGFKEPYFCKICNKVVNNCYHNKRKIYKISGSEIRSLIISKKKISKKIMREKISKSLSNKSII